MKQRGVKDLAPRRTVGEILRVVTSESNFSLSYLSAVQTRKQQVHRRRRPDFGAA